MGRVIVAAILGLATLAAACRGGSGTAPSASVDTPREAERSGNVWLAETFADPSLPGWTRVDGATLGQGDSSQVVVQDGALFFSATAATRRFVAVQRDLSVAGAEEVSVQVRMRTEDVDPSVARFRNCDAYVRFDGGPVMLASRTGEGTTPWLRSTRILSVPAGARTMTLGLVLTMPGRAWFDDVLVRSGEAPFVRSRSGRFDYHHVPGDELPQAAMDANDRAWQDASRFFGWSPAEPIEYWKYRSREDIEEFTGFAGVGEVIGSAIHTTEPTEPHELAHVFAARWGHPVALLGEGVGVYFSGHWQSSSVRDAAAAVLHAGQWVSLAELLDTRSFRAHPDMVTYPIAGAFAAWVDTRLGHSVLASAYATVENGRSSEEERALFVGALGDTPERIDARLRADLDEKPH